MEHRRLPDLRPPGRDRCRPHLGQPVATPDDAAHRDLHAIDPRQQPANGTHRDPQLFAQGDDQTQQADAEPLATGDHPGKRCWGRRDPLGATRTGPGEEAVFGDGRRRQRHLDDFAGPLDPAPDQPGATVRALLRRVGDGRTRHTPSPDEGEAPWRARGRRGGRRLGRFGTGHRSPWSAAADLLFKDPDPFGERRDRLLLSGNQRLEGAHEIEQRLAAGGLQVRGRVHPQSVHTRYTAPPPTRIDPLPRNSSLLP